VCPSLACVGFGQAYAVEEVLAELGPEQPLYRNSGGGVTFSGGEPFTHAAFALELTRRLRRDRVHVAAETCGHFSPDGDAITLLGELDLAIYDLKVFDEQRHREYCGVGNALIKSNFTNLARDRRVPLWPRIPLIPGVTDTIDNLEQWADFLEQVAISYLTLVPYHNLGAAKRRWLGLPQAPAFEPLGQEQRDRAFRLLEWRGFAVFEPGEEVCSLVE
jgi:pyruvate formate lyase activating enzyme